MSSYSTTIKNMVERYTRREPELNQRERIDKAREHLFPPSYPIWEEEYRGVFETNFIRRFYFVEVGFEVGERFIFELENWLTLNMPYYVKMWESERFKYDPLTNYDRKTKHKIDREHDQKDKRKDTYQSNVDQEGERGLKEDDKRNATSDDTRNQVTDEQRNDVIKSSRESDTDETSKDTENTNVNQESSNEAFNREVESQQPDTRLNLTTNADGSGAIEYADKIDEKINKSNDTSQSDSDTTRDGRRDTRTIENSDSESDGLTNRNVDEKGNVTSEETGTRNQDETSRHNMSSQSDGTNDLDRNITNVENFIEHTYGSAGVKTYPELIEDYRNSLLRLEVMIFNDMRKDLFMKIF